MQVLMVEEYSQRICVFVLKNEKQSQGTQHPFEQSETYELDTFCNSTNNPNLNLKTDQIK